MQEHPLAQQLIARAMKRETLMDVLRFDYAASGVNKTALEAFRGQGGFLRVYRLSYDGFDHEEHLIPLAFTDSGEPFPDCPLVHDLLNLPASCSAFTGTVDDAKFEELLQKEQKAVDGDVEERAGVTFDEYVERIYVMSEDLETGLRIDLERLVNTKNDLSRKASKSKKMEEKLVLQKQIREAAMAYNKKESELFAERKRIEDQRDELISNAEKLNNSKQTTEVLFTARWELI